MASAPGLRATLDRLAGAVAPLTLARERVLPVPRDLEAALPGGLRRGSTVCVEGSSWLALALVSEASAQGSWCAAVGMPALGMAAAEAAGADLSRFALVPHPGRRWPEAAAALADAMDVVLLGVAPRPADARRLAARARERGAVLVACSGWPQRPDVGLRVVESIWEGLGDGHGHLRRRTMVVESTGRGAASIGRRAVLRVP